MLVSLTYAAAESVPQVKIGPPPAWVKPLTFVPDASVADQDSDGSTLYYLQDEQVKADEKTGYHHWAMQFLTKGAVEDSSQITISVNPAYQELTFNTLLIHRDGKVLDRLGKQEIKLLQRESRLDWNLFDGRLSAVVILDDIRVGDILEYSYTLKGENPVFGQHFMDAFYLQWSEPVKSLRYRLLWPKDRYLGIQDHRTHAQPKVTGYDENTDEYIWESKDVPALLSDGNLPSWYEPWGWVQLTEYNSWNEVALWADAIYPKGTPMPEELAKEIKSTAELKDPKAQIMRTLQYVQDNIRYLGIEVGANSHEPHPIDVVWQQRFGDCKDKALLLSAMLRELGFEAYPALVSTDARIAVKDWLPSPLAFDHVIVQVKLDGRTYWMDPTRRNQGQDLDQLYFPAYGYALVIRPETQSLTEIKPGGYETSASQVTESFGFKDFSGDATLKVESVFTGAEADRMRAYLADTRKAEVQKNYLNYYARQFPDIESVSPPRFQDDRAKNIITADEHYRIAKFWMPGSEGKERLAAEFSASSVTNMVQKPSSPVRSMPMALSYPNKVTHIIEIEFPRALGLSKEKTELDDPAFKFTYTAEPEGKKTTLRYAYETKADHVKPGAVGAYLTKVETMRNLLGYQLTIPAAWATAAPAESDAESATVQRPTPDHSAFIAMSAFVAFLALASLAGLILWWRLSRVTVTEPPSIPLHCCAECGATEKTDPSMEFRVAHNGHEYCRRHLSGRV